MTTHFKLWRQNNHSVVVWGYVWQRAKFYNVFLGERHLVAARYVCKHVVREAWQMMVFFVYLPARPMQGTEDNPKNATVCLYIAIYKIYIRTSLQFEQFLTEIGDVVLGCFQALLQPLLTSTRQSNSVVINSFRFRFFPRQNRLYVTFAHMQ